MTSVSTQMLSGQGGFDYSLCQRNAHLLTKGVKASSPIKTGTTICGVIFADGLVLGADTRSTAGTVVADKNCQKIHPITDKIFCCGAGTAADCDMVTAMVASNMKLHAYATGRPARVVTVKTMLSQHLFGYQGYVGAALIVGGVDVNGAHLYSVHPHGSVDCLPFDAMGSGSLNAISMLETFYKDNMTKEAAMDLVAGAIKYGVVLIVDSHCVLPPATLEKWHYTVLKTSQGSVPNAHTGVFNDLGSGSNVDLCIITKDGAEMKRNYEMLQVKLFARQFPIDFYASPATVTKEKKLVSLADVVVTEGEPEAMEEG